MKTILRAKSSSGGAYDVEFQVAGGSVRVFCHCQAGVLRQMCKHKLALIRGEAPMLFDATQTALLSALRAWPEFEPLKGRAADYEQELREIEAAKSELTRREKEIKTRFAQGLAHGFK